MRLGDYFQVSEQKKNNNQKRGEAAISKRDEPQLHSSPSSPRAHSGPSTLRHVGGNFCSRQLQTSPTPPRHSDCCCCCSLRSACVLFHLADRIFFFSRHLSGSHRQEKAPILTRDKRGEMRGGDGSQSEVRVAARCGAARSGAEQPLLSTLRCPGKKLSG